VEIRNRLRPAQIDGSVNVTWRHNKRRKARTNKGASTQATKMQSMLARENNKNAKNKRKTTTKRKKV
jgi:hypothetical protein